MLIALLDEPENEFDFSSAIFYNLSLRHSVASVFMYLFYILKFAHVLNTDNINV